METLCNTGFLDKKLYVNMLNQLNAIKIDSEKDAFDFINLIYYYKFAIPVDLEEHTQSISMLEPKNILHANDLQKFQDFTEKNKNLKILQSTIFPIVNFVYFLINQKTEEYKENDFEEYFSYLENVLYYDLNILTFFLNENINNGKISLENGIQYLFFILNQIHFRTNQNWAQNEYSETGSQLYGNFQVGFSDNLTWAAFITLFKVLHYIKKS
jgi:hypothetical protein